MEKQAETIATESVKKADGQKVLKLRVIRDGKEGLKLFMQSNQDWDFLKAATDRTFVIGGVKCSMPRQESLSGVDCRFYQDGALEYDGMPNLSVLLATNLKDGAEFKFGAFPISEQKITEYLSQLKQSVKVIYLTYMRPFNVEVSINTHTVEREEHS